MSLLFPGSQSGNGVVLRNIATGAAQEPTAATRVLVNGTSIKVPPGGLKVGSKIRFYATMTKTAAGTATSTFDIGFGTSPVAASATARVAFTKPAGTAAVDEATVLVEATVRSVSATGVVVGQFVLVHNLAATGHAQIPCVVVNTVSSGFDNTSEELYVGLYITTGASDAITIQVASAELYVPTNGQN